MVCCSSHRFSTSGQFAAAELILLMTTKWQSLRRRPDRTLLNSCSSRCRATYIRIQALLQSIPVPFVLATSPVEWAINATDVLDGCTQNVPDSAQYQRSSDWACGPCSTPSPPPTPTPPTDIKKRGDSMFNILQLNANGIGNKLTELGVVMENNKVKVAVIQESKLTPKFQNPCIQNYTTVRKDRPHGQGGGLLIFIHRSVTFSKQPSSA